LVDEYVAVSVVKLKESTAKSVISKEGLKEFGCL
jgi:hypothetical protein